MPTHKTGFSVRNINFNMCVRLVNFDNGYFVLKTDIKR